MDAYTATTFGFNLLVTALICARIAYVGRRTRRCYSHHMHTAGVGADGAEAAAVYTGAVAIVVESALPFTVFSLAYLVAYAVGSALANAFSFYAMFTVSSPVPSLSSPPRPPSPPLLCGSC